ncbi:hypothetical protein RHSIM_Rhsim05G0036100 [Rhododendron simsii]|uniref:Uncharacterized protein n=1 Tax=Rhododendron simsii TaxID=118357 RepID=A0A834GV54_RHOSS|nr:hypothetical protein RHSIM_Rhsim05G0036100 [Rhododendron simsii]
MKPIVACIFVVSFLMIFASLVRFDVFVMPLGGSKMLVVDVSIGPYQWLGRSPSHQEVLTPVQLLLRLQNHHHHTQAATTTTPQTSLAMDQETGMEVELFGQNEVANVFRRDFKEGPVTLNPIDYKESENAGSYSEWASQVNDQSTLSTPYQNHNALVFPQPQITSMLSENRGGSIDWTNSLASQAEPFSDRHISGSSNLAFPTWSDQAAPRQHAEGQTMQFTAHPNPNALGLPQFQIASSQVPSANEDRRNSLASQVEAFFMGHVSESSNLAFPEYSDAAPSSQPVATILTEKQDTRSNLQLTVMFLQDLSLRADHLNLLKQTPFWLIIDSIISRTLDADKCIKSDTVFKKLLVAYNPETDCFTIAGKNVKLTANHVKLIFGISCGTEPFAAKLKTREQVAFAKRRNIQQRLTTKAISDMLKELAQENKTSIEDVQDVARLVCMFLIVKLFFPTSGITVSWKHVDAMEDLTKMKSYNWAAEIHNELVESIKKSQHSPKDVKGCQLLLPYWLCEHTNILEQELSEHQVPRLLKWNISTLEHALQAIPNIVKARKIKDSGSTLVPNTYLPTNAEVFLHLMLSPLPAYIHPDQDEPQPNLEFLCSSAVQRVTEPLVEQLQEVNRQQEVIIDTLKEQNKTNEVKMAELLQKIDFLYKERRNQQGKDKEALLLAIQNIKESHMAISEEKLQMEFEFIEAAAKQEQQLTDARMALIEEKKISLELKETAGKLAQELKNARMEKMQMELEFIEAAAKQEQQLTDAQMALIEDKKISLAEKKAAEKKEHQLQTEKTQLEEEKMVFLEEVEALQQHKQKIERNNAELERENKELKKELLETKQRSKGSPKLEPFSNETEEQNIEQQVHSVTQSAQVKPYSTQDTLEFVHTIT